MKFTKMHGLGNDYVYVDVSANMVEDPVGLARAISDRHTGVGSDGLILVAPSDVADVRMEMYNADGSRGLMCGNGIRCVAKYAVERGLATGPCLRIETDSGVKTVTCLMRGTTVLSVRVDMGHPDLSPARLPATISAERIVDYPITIGDVAYVLTCVSMGNPHAVVFVDDVHAVDLAADGPRIEHARVFPDRINVHFVTVVNYGHLRMRTWERGSGVTLACGTGACAACVAAAVTQRAARQATVTLPGGDLTIEWAEDDHVYMTGPAVEVFAGDWPA